MSDIKIYQNQGGDIRWDGKQSALYDFELDPGGCVKGLEFLRDDDPRYARVANDRTIKLVDKMPSGDDIKELQDFIDRGNFKPEWIAGWMERLLAESARVESELKAQEAERQAEANRADERRKHNELIAALNKVGKSQRSASVPDEVPPDYSDPVVTRIRNSGDPCPKKLENLYFHSLKYKAWSGPDVGKLIGETSDAIRNALFRMRKKAADLKKKEDEMER